MIRSSKKPPFIDYKLISKIFKESIIKKKEIIKTWSRSSTIIPQMIGRTIGVYNGKKHIPVYISDNKVGFKLGEFSLTRKTTRNKLDK